MALAFEPLEEIQLPILPTPPRAKRGRASKSKNSAITTAVDLTSVSTPTHWASTTRPVSPDVDLTGGATPPHSSSPMFQPCKKYIEPSKNVDGISDSFDIDLVNIKLKLDDKIETHTIRQHQKFLDIFKAVADLHKISISDVLIYNDSKRVHYDDTPHSISYRASIFLSEY